MTTEESKGEPSSNTEISLDAGRLNSGIKLQLEGRPVHLRGISPDVRVIANYLKALELKTASGSMVVPEVYLVYVPATSLDSAATTTERRLVLIAKDEKKLPFVTLDSLSRASRIHKFKVIYLLTEEDFMAASLALGITRESFLNTASQTSQLIFISEWAGPNIPDYLNGCQSDVAVQRTVGINLGENLTVMHNAGLIAGDTHLRQFVVRGGGESVARVDLNNIYSTQQVDTKNKSIEFSSLYQELTMGYGAAGIAFAQTYLGK